VPTEASATKSRRTRTPRYRIAVNYYNAPAPILAIRPTGDNAAVLLDFVLNWQHLVR
jgi:hypothetical protein